MVAVGISRAHIEVALLPMGRCCRTSGSTRLDASLLIGTPMFMLLWYRHGSRVVLPILTGAGISFFVSDPFLWFMPIQHITDLAQKFTVHYRQIYYTKIEPAAMVNAVWLSATRLSRCK